VKARPAVAALVVCVVVGALLRLSALGLHSLWFDELATLHVVRAPDLTEVLARDRHPPLFYWLLARWERVFDGGEGALRALPALISCGGLLVFACALHQLVRRERIAPAAACTAVALYALSPFSIWYAQELRAHSMLEFTGALALASLVAAQDRCAKWAAGSAALATAIGLGSHYMGALLVPAVLVAGGLLWWRERGDRISAFAPALGALLGFAIWVPWLVGMLPRQSATAWQPLARLDLRSLLELPARLVLVELADLDAFTTGCALAVAALIYLGLALALAAVLRRRAGFETVALVAAFALLGSALALALLVSPNFLPRYLIGAAPFLLVGIAAGLAALRPRALSSTLVVLLLCGCAWIVRAHRVHGSKQDFRAAFRSVESSWQPGDRVAVLAGGFDGFAEAPARHYLEGRPELLAALVPSVELLALPASAERGSRLHLVVYDAPFTRAETAALLAAAAECNEQRFAKDVRHLLIRWP
jgi:uncharacterized membrane protein